jgi:hypothetical protein
MTPKELKQMFHAIAASRLGTAWFRDQAGIIIIERKAHFAAGQSPTGENWPRNKPATIKRKGFDGPNVATGQMARAYIGEVTNNSATVKIADKRTENVWQGKSIAQLTHDGTKRAEPRPHIGIPVKAIARIRRAFSLQVTKTVKSVMGKHALRSKGK